MARTDLWAFVEYPVCLRGEGGETQRLESIVEEVPVALVFNGISHAVMLATPRDIESFALGFSLSENIIDHPGELYELDVVVRDEGIEVQMRIAEAQFARLKGNRRTMAGRTGCGLCGIESLSQAIRRPVPVKGMQCVSGAAVLLARERISVAQELYRCTGAVHAAAWCGPDGELRIVKEDVGRHNALDKIIGEAMNRHEALDSGFVFVTSRASYEMVCKIATVGIGALASISAPTSLAVRFADECGIALIGRAEADRYRVYTYPERVVA